MVSTPSDSDSNSNEEAAVELNCLAVEAREEASAVSSRSDDETEANDNLVVINPSEPPLPPQTNT